MHLSPVIKKNKKTTCLTPSLSLTDTIIKNSNLQTGICGNRETEFRSELRQIQKQKAKKLVCNPKFKIKAGTIIFVPNTHMGKTQAQNFHTTT